MNCPNCHHKGSQTYRGESYNIFSHAHEGLFRCETCRCEYIEKDSGWVVITQVGMTNSEIREARHAFVAFPLTVPAYTGMLAC